MKPIDTTPQKEATDAELSPVLGLETAARLKVPPLLSGCARQPSPQAIDILAKMMANRARRTILADQSDQTKANAPASFKP